MPTRISTCCASFALGLVLVGCTANRTPADVTAILFNYSGQQLNAATVEDSAGGHATFEGPLPNRFLDAAGGLKPPRGSNHSVTLQWTQGAGRMVWREARLQLGLEQREGNRVEIYLRPDGRVCARLLDEAHRPQDTDDAVRRATQEPVGQTCVQPTTLPQAAPQSAAVFELGTASYSWDRHDRPGTTTLTLLRLNHPSGPVRIRFGEAFKGGPWYLDEFKTIRAIGDRSALLVEANLRPADPGLYLVQGDSRSWTSRFVGGTRADERTVSPGRLLFGSRVLVDFISGQLFRLPYAPYTDYRVLDESPDRQRLVLLAAGEVDRQGTAKPDTAASILIFELESGVLSPPIGEASFTVPLDNSVHEFGTQWYRKSCTWQPGPLPRLKCAA